MRRNLGIVDRSVRLVLAALGWWVAETVGYGSAGGVLALVAAGILAATGAVGYCPLYAVLRVTTSRGSRRVVAGGH